jgi:hypothetical protein
MIPGTDLLCTSLWVLDHVAVRSAGHGAVATDTGDEERASSSSLAVSQLAPLDTTLLAELERERLPAELVADFGTSGNWTEQVWVRVLIILSKRGCRIAASMALATSAVVERCELAGLESMPWGLQKDVPLQPRDDAVWFMQSTKMLALRSLSAGLSAEARQLLAPDSAAAVFPGLRSLDSNQRSKKAEEAMRSWRSRKPVCCASATAESLPDGKSRPYRASSIEIDS